MKKIKVLSVFGTRPEAIKMAPLVIELAKSSDIESICCVTGQHREMLDSVMEIFSLKADYDLNIMEKQYYRGFPISEAEENKIEAWKTKHDVEDHGYDTFEKRLKAEGVFGGRYSYHFYPTAIGICGEIHCSCGAKFEFQSI